MQWFSFSPPINFSVKKWFLGVTSFECTNSVFNITDENNSFSITTPSHWESESAEKTTDELKKLLELKSRNVIELDVEQVRKKGVSSKNNYSLSSLGTFKSEILEEMKCSEYKDLEDLVYRFQLTYDEIKDILDQKYIVGSKKTCTLPPGIYEIIDINFMLKSLLPE